MTRIIIAILLAISPAFADITSNLVFKVDFTENGGTTAADSSGGGRTMTCSPVWATGPNGIGYAIGPLNGSSQSCNTTSSAVSAYPATLTGWVKLASTTGGAVVSVGTSTSSASYAKIVIASNGEARIGMRPDAGAEHVCGSGPDLRDGQWHHLVGVLTSATVRYLYVDGIPHGCGTGQTSKAFPSAPDVMSAGRTVRTTSIDYLNGSVALIRVYSRSLTAAEAIESFEDGGGTMGPLRSNHAPATNSYHPLATSKTISLDTSDNSTCKWSTTASTDYASMANTFSTTGGTTHSTTATVASGSNTIYVKCVETATGSTNTTDYPIQFNIGRVLYVTTTGTNAGNCLSAGSPCLTITYAKEVASAGDEVYIAPGYYPERPYINNRNGQAGAPIVFRGHDGTGCPTTPLADINSPRGVRPAPTVSMWGFYVKAHYNVYECFAVIPRGHGHTLESGDTGAALQMHRDSYDIVQQDFNVDGSSDPGYLEAATRTGATSSPEVVYNITVRRNVVKGTGYGYYLNCNNCTIEDNESYELETPYASVDLDHARFFGNGQTWRRNYFHGNHYDACPDTDPDPMVDTRCHMDCFQSFGYTDETATNITWDSNVCFNVHQGIITRYADSSSHNTWTVKNNIFAYGPIGGGGMAWCGLFDGVSGITYEHNICRGARVFLVNGASASVKYNIFFAHASFPYVEIKTEIGATTGDWASATNGTITASEQNILASGVASPCPAGKYANDICAVDPLLVDPNNYNFRLQSGSPAINAATTSTLNIDLLGTVRPQGAARDIGPYEYIASAVRRFFRVVTTQ